MTDNEPNLTPGVSRYFGLLDQRDLLQARIAEASPLTRSLYEDGILGADRQIAELEQAAEVVSYLTDLGAPLVAGLAELTELRSAIDGGLELIPVEQVDALEGEIQGRIAADPQLQRAISYLGTKAVEPVVEADPTEPVLDDATQAETIATAQPVKAPAPAFGEISGEQEVKPLKITYRAGVVRIGKGGKIIKTTEANQANQRDYTAERLRILEVLIENKGTAMTASELWDQAYPGIPADRNAMGQVRAWLPKITFNHRPVVEHNGKRGNGSKYGIFAFDVELVKEQVTSSPRIPSPPTPLNVMPKHKTLTEPTQLEEAVAAIEASIEPEETPADKNGFPLSSYETSLIAEFLQVNREALRALEIPELDDKVVEKLRSRTSHQQTILAERVHGSLEIARKVAIDQLREFFDDEDKVLQVATTMSEQDHRYELFEYFFGLEGNDDRWALFEQLITAQRTTGYNAEGGPRGGYRIDPASVRHGVHLAGSGLVEYLPPSESPDRALGEAQTTLTAGASQEREPLTAAQLSTDGTEQLFNDPEVAAAIDEMSERDEASNAPDVLEDPAVIAALDEGSADSDTSSTSESNGVAQHKAKDTVLAPAKKAPESAARLQFAAELRSVVWAALDTIEGQRLVGKTRPNIQALFPFMTSSFVHGASENGHISRGRLDFTRADLINMIVLDKYPQAYGVRRSSTKPDSRLIKQIIREQCEAWEAKHKPTDS